jgi:hypothetical protein
MRSASFGFAAALLATSALAQTPAATPAKPVIPKPVAVVRHATAPVAAAPVQLTPEQKDALALLNTAVPGKDGVKRLVIMRGLDKITGRPANVLAPIGVPVTFATMTITARYCYSTPPSEPPETTAFVQIEDHRPDQDARAVFSGWMLASSPSLNGLQHPLYDVWVISCTTNQPGQMVPLIASTAAVKVTSPDATAKEAAPELPEGAGQ